MRERIQTSVSWYKILTWFFRLKLVFWIDQMDRFTRETLEVDSPEDNHGQSAKMEKVFERAAWLVRRTLDVEGAFVMDVSHFEMVETAGPNGRTTVSYHGDLFEGAGPQTRTTPDAAPLSHSNFGPIPPPPILGADGPSLPPFARGQFLNGDEHAALSAFLRQCPDGKIYERVVPSCFRRVIPSNFQIAIGTSVLHPL